MWTLLATEVSLSFYHLNITIYINHGRIWNYTWRYYLKISTKHWYLLKIAHHHISQCCHLLKTVLYNIIWKLLSPKDFTSPHDLYIAIYWRQNLIISPEYCCQLKTAPYPINWTLLSITAPEHIIPLTTDEKIWQIISTEESTLPHLLEVASYRRQFFLLIIWTFLSM